MSKSANTAKFWLLLELVQCNRARPIHLSSVYLHWSSQLPLGVCSHRRSLLGSKCSHAPTIQLTGRRGPNNNIIVVIIIKSTIMIIIINKNNNYNNRVAKASIEIAICTKQVLGRGALGRLGCRASTTKINTNNATISRAATGWWVRLDRVTVFVWLSMVEELLNSVENYSAAASTSRRRGTTNPRPRAGCRNDGKLCHASASYVPVVQTHSIVTLKLESAHLETTESSR